MTPAGPGPTPQETAPQGIAPQGIEAQLALGQMLLEAGEGASAWEAFAAAARRGDGRAMTMLGRLAEHGWAGRAPDPAAAAHHYRRAAAAGSGWALFNLADLHLTGRGVAPDAAGAVALYSRAAEAGVAQALNMLGLCCEEGQGLPADRALARRYYAAGAEAGDCWASFNLGRLMLEEGEFDAALIRFRRAYDTGFAGFWRRLAEALAPLDDPRFRALARAALSRAEAGEAALRRRRTGEEAAS
uniref:tetratricopeptide repeat protein n=1 Tax=Paenirhodobacter enshiensis TaxID=1105367 RepID=UPI0035AE13A0